MTPLMISSEVQNYAFLVELPVESVFSENEDIQTIHIDECSSLTSSSINSAIQPMIIASTDSEGNCFVTLQDEQTYNSCSPWASQNEIANGEATEILSSSLTLQQTTVLPSTVTIPGTVPTTTAIRAPNLVAASPEVAIAPAGAAAAATSAVSVSTKTITTSSGTILPQTVTAAAATTTPLSSNSVRNLSATYRAKTDVHTVVNSTEVPNTTKSVNNRSYVGLRSFMRCGRSRMIADNFTSISVSEFKSQLNDTSDIIGKLDLAPSTKRRMNLLQWKGIGKLFASPGQKFMSEKLMKLFKRHLRTKLLQSEETFSDMELLPVGYKPEVDPTKIKRITRRRRYPEAEEYQRRMFQAQMQQTLQNLVASGHSQIQTVYMENTDTFQDQSQETMQILIESADNSSYIENDADKIVGVYGNDHNDDSSIIVIHNSQETDQASAFSHQNIEVLLAAAGENGLHSDGFHQVIICNTENDAEPCASSIIIVPNDPLCDTITETVVSS